PVVSPAATGCDVGALEGGGAMAAGAGAPVGGGVGGGVGCGVGGGVGGGVGFGVGLGVGVGDGEGEGCGRAARTGTPWVPAGASPSEPQAASSSNAAASVSPRWRRSMPFPCLLPRISAKQDTERDGKRTDRGWAGPAYH